MTALRGVCIAILLGGPVAAADIPAAPQLLSVEVVPEPAPTDGDSPSSGLRGAHEMTGTVVAVNRTTGTVSLETGGDELRLRFPPAALAQVKEGDTLTVELAIRDLHRPPRAVPPTR